MLFLFSFLGEWEGWLRGDEMSEERKADELGLGTTRIFLRGRYTSVFSLRFAGGLRATCRIGAPLHTEGRHRTI